MSDTIDAESPRRMADVPGLVETMLAAFETTPDGLKGDCDVCRMRRAILALADDAGLREAFAGIIWGADQADKPPTCLCSDHSICRSHATTADALMAVLRDAAKGTPT